MRKYTRSEFLKAAGAGTAGITLTGATGCEPEQARSGPPPSTRKKSGRSPQPAQAKRGVWAFRSRPDLAPPVIDVSTRAHDTAPGHVFVAPKKGVGRYGPMIVDDRGQLVWFRPLQDRDEYAMDFKVQDYRGKQVLTWAEGRVVAGHGLDEYVILDGSYREITRVRAGNGYVGDHHEFLISPQDTALITIYHPARRDLTPYGGPKDGAVYEGIAQELDIESGEVLFEWHSLEHVGLDESYATPPEDPRAPFDYFHINSIDVDYDNNLLVSAKKTFTVYKIDRRSGEIIWRLGGKRSDFEMGPGTRTAYQHDARRQPDGTITIFDNGAAPKVHEQSRAIVVETDEERMSASLVREYTHPHKLLAGSQGNMQVLPNSNVFVGWGSEPFFSEFTGGGDLLFDARFPPKDESYRAFRFPWSAQPSEDPAVAAQRTSEEEVTVHASWNGATELTTWEVLAGPDPDGLEPVASAPRDGFETTIVVDTTAPYVGVRARDRSGKALGSSKAIRPAPQ